MRKTAIALFAGLLIAGPVAVAGAVDTKGPPCADIVDGGGVADADSVDVRLVLAKPSCSTVTYRITVYDEPTDTTPLGVASMQGTGATELTLSVATADRDPGELTFFFERSETLIRGHVADVAPNAGFMEICFDNDPTDTTECPTAGRGHN
jgi:hypothetical protein